MEKAVSKENVLLYELIWPALTNSSSSLTVLNAVYKPAEGEKDHQELPNSPGFPECLQEEQYAHCYLHCISNFW